MSEFTQLSTSGVLGDLRPVIDPGRGLSTESFSGVLGDLSPVLDPDVVTYIFLSSASAVSATTSSATAIITRELALSANGSITTATISADVLRALGLALAGQVSISTITVTIRVAEKIPVLRIEGMTSVTGGLSPIPVGIQAQIQPGES